MVFVGFTWIGMIGNSMRSLIGFLGEFFWDNLGLAGVTGKIYVLLMRGALNFA